MSKWVHRVDLLTHQEKDGSGCWFEHASLLNSSYLTRQFVKSRDRPIHHKLRPCFNLSAKTFLFSIHFTATNLLLFFFSHIEMKETLPPPSLTSHHHHLRATTPTTHKYIVSDHHASHPHRSHHHTRLSDKVIHSGSWMRFLVSLICRDWNFLELSKWIEIREPTRLTTSSGRVGL